MDGAKANYRYFRGTRLKMFEKFIYFRVVTRERFINADTKGKLWYFKNQDFPMEEEFKWKQKGRDMKKQ